MLSTEKDPEKIRTKLEVHPAALAPWDIFVEGVDSSTVEDDNFEEMIRKERMIHRQKRRDVRECSIIQKKPSSIFLL